MKVFAPLIDTHDSERLLNDSKYNIEVQYE
jgi:hypothetical protein